MAEIASAFVTIAPSAKGFGSRLNSQVSGETRSAGQAIGRTFGKMFVLGASVIAAAGIGSFLKGSIAEAREAQKVGAQTNAVLKSTGQVSGITADQIGKMATRLSNFSGIDDEAIQSGENLLLTFTNIRNEVGGKFVGTFDQATQAAVDMGVALGTDTKSAALALGKALNDPAKGYAKLQRSGVSFTDSQIEQIKNFEKTGDLAKAQGIILGEVTKEFGGSAAAQATAGDKAKVAFDNIKESIGTALLPALDSAERAFTRLTPQIQSGIATLGPFFKGLLKSVRPLVSQLRDTLQPALEQLFGFLKANPKVLAVIGAAFLALGAPVAAVGLGLALLYAKSATFRDIVTQVVRALQEFGTKAAPVVSAFLTRMTVLIKTQVIPAIIAFVGFVRGQVIPALLALASWFQTKVVPVIVSTAKSVAKSLLPVFQQVVSTVQTQVIPAAQRLIAAFQKARPTIQRVVEVALKFWAALIRLQASILGKVLPVLIRFAAFLIGAQVKALAKVGTAIGQTIVKVIDFGRKVVAAVESAKKFADGVVKQGQRVLTWFKALPGKVKGFLASLPGQLKTIGGHIVDGLVNGIKAAAHKVDDAVHAIVDRIPKKIRQIMGINSPSKVTFALGGFIGDGLANGIAAKESKVGQAVEKLGKKVKEKVAKLRDTLSGLRSDFASLVEPISSNFTQGLFDFDTASAFTANLSTVKGTLATLIANFTKLKGEGLSPGFLYQLFQSGGPGLINSLAALDTAGAQSAAALFGDVTSLSDQLGTAVAGSTDKGAAIEKQTTRLENKLDQLIKHVDQSAHRTGLVVNGAAANGHRRGK